MVSLKGGFFEMGARKSRYPQDLDSPTRKIRVAPFRISKFTVTNAVFAQFVQETGYKTTAEIEGWSYVFHMHLPRPTDYPHSPPGTPWWRQVHGACWHQPEGPDSSVQDRPTLPAVHLSWYDAASLAGYLGMRLPLEAEWEFAARGGLKRKKFPWGNTLEPAAGHRHNVWQGHFPTVNSAEDGFEASCPVNHFPPNGFGLHNMTGNVWEWCEDWFGPLPKGPSPHSSAKTGDQKIVRGGSFLCHASYCERYQTHSRTSNTPDSTTGHMGVRLVADL